MEGRSFACQLTCLITLLTIVQITQVTSEQGGRYRRQEGEETTAEEAVVTTAKPEGEVTTAKPEVTTVKPEGEVTTAKSEAEVTSAKTEGGGGEVTTTKPKGGGGGATNGAKPSRVCSTELFKRLDRCCPTPILINSVEIQKCARRSRFKRSDKSDFYNIPNFNFLINMMRRTGENRAPRGRVGKRAQKGGTNGAETHNQGITISQLQIIADTMPAVCSSCSSLFSSHGKTTVTPAPKYVKTNVNQVCLVECIFINLNWVMEDQSINVNSMFATLAAMVPPAWTALINSAKTECASILQTGAAATMYNPSTGADCLKAPTKMMRCIKKTLISSCPTVINSGAKCMEDSKILKDCDVTVL